MVKFFAKHLQDNKPQKNRVFANAEKESKEEEIKIVVPKEPIVEKTIKKENKPNKKTAKKVANKGKNNISENKSTMDTAEKIAMAQNILGRDKENKFKFLKADKGLIERTESSKTILTEDNKELLID